MEKLNRYTAIKENYYYDCILNKIVYSTKQLYQEIREQRLKLVPQYDKTYIETNLKSNRQQLILSVTEKCNLRCEYCAYYDTRYENNSVSKIMSFDTAKKAIDEYITHSKLAEKRCISFYGGEPLLNFTLIKQCVEYIDSLNLNKEMTFLITTNALLLSDEIAHFLYKYKFNINISLDGPENIQDRYRIDTKKEKTFSKVIESVNRLLELDYEYCKTNLYFLSVLSPPKSLKSILDYFSLMPFGNQFSRLIITSHMKSVLYEMYKHGIKDEEDINTDNYPREREKKIQSINRIRKVLDNSSIWNNTLAPGAYCLPLVRRLFVSSDGGYYICEKCDQIEKNCFGNIDKGIDYNKLYEKQNDVLDFHQRFCKSCWALRFCNVCYANMDRYPNCCEEFKEDIISTLNDLIELDEKSI